MEKKDVFGDASFLERFIYSAKELKSVSNLCIISILMAMKIVLHMVGTIRLTQSMYIGFGFLVVVVVGSMFGPFVSIFFGLFADILGFIVAPDGKFHFGFTLNSVLGALIYSLFLYKFRLSTKRIVITSVVHDIVINFVLNSMWLAQMYYGNSFIKSFVLRLPKGLIMLPIHCLLCIAVAKALKRVSKISNII